MAYQAVGIGAAANDGTGDSLRAGGAKIDANFVELYAIVAAVKTPNFVFCGPASGATDALPTFRALVGADLPAPQAGAFGGVRSLAAVANNFFTGLGTDGIFTRAQPAFSDLSGQATLGQFPSIAATTVLGNSTGSAAAPTAVSMASLSTMLGLGTFALISSLAFSSLTGKPTTIAGYGITDAYTKTEIDTSLALKANLASPTFTGVPLAPTAAALTNTTQIATTAYVRTEIANLVNSAPGILDTLGEIATQLQADESVAAALATTVAGKVAKAGDTMTGLLQFSGTGHAGLQLNPLTTTQRDALTGVAGQIVWNSTLSKFSWYDSAWRVLGSAALIDTGTSGTKVALTDGANTWSALNTYSAGVTLSAGVLQLPRGTTAAPSIRFNESNTGIYSAGADSIDMTFLGTRRHAYDTNSYVILSTTATVTFNETNLTRHAIDVIAQRRTTNKQTHKWNYSYTDDSNESYGYVDLTTASTLIFGSNGIGTGAGVVTKFRLNVDGTNRLDYGVTNAGQWQISGVLNTNNNISCTAQISAGSTSFMGFLTRSYFDSPADSKIRMTNNAGTDFSMLLWGGTSASFPAIKRNGAGLEFRLADDSAAAAYTGQFIGSANGALSAPGQTFTGTWIITGGTATTTKPYHLIEPAGTTSTGWSLLGTGLGINAAAAFAGNLIDAQVAGSTVLRVTNVGTIQGTQNINGFAANNVVFDGYTNFTGNLISFGALNAQNCVFDFAGQHVAVFHATAALGWSSSASGSVSATTLRSNMDLKLFRDGAANTLAQRNGTAAQVRRWYSTWTDASNGAWAELNLATANTLIFGSTGNGTGASTMSKLQFNVLGAAVIDYGVATANTWTIASGKNFVCTGDIVFNGASKFIQLNNSGGIYWASRTEITSQVNGQLRIATNDSSSFDSLLLGPSGTTFNRLKHISAGVLGLKLADDSAYSILQAKLRLETAAAPSSAGDTGVAGDVRWASGFVYVCVATNTWQRAAIATW